MFEQWNHLLTLSPWIPVLVISLIAFLIGFLLRFILLQFFRYWQDHDRPLFKSLEQHLRGSFLLFIPLIVCKIGFSYLALPTQAQPTLTNILNIGIILSLASVMVRLTNVVQDLLFRRYDISKADNLRARKVRTQIIYVKKIAIVVIIALAFALILLNFSSVRKFGTTILTGAGVAGIIIGFALQKSLANLFAGIQIAFTQPIKIDDAVVVENEWGWIEEINLTYVVVRIWDMRRLVLPITYFTENTFQNWTRNSAQILGSVHLYVDYAMPLEPLREQFIKTLEQTELWDGQAQAFQVTDTDEKTMTIRLLMTAKNSPTAWDLRCYIREQMITFIQTHYREYLPKVRAQMSDPSKTPPEVSSCANDQPPK